MIGLQNQNENKDAQIYEKCGIKVNTIIDRKRKYHVESSKIWTYTKNSIRTTNWENEEENKIIEER